jgi:ABC-type transport system involved in cytochrome c biogenesis permease subunit
MILFLRILSPLLYLLTAVFYFHFFRLRSQRTKDFARISEIAAIVLHAVLLIILTVDIGNLPLSGPFQSLSMFMFFFALLNKFLIRAEKEYTLGIFHTAIIFLFQAISMIFLQIESPIPEILQNLYFEVHVLVNLIGYASFSSAFLTGLMYLLLFHEIKGPKLGYFYDRLPSLAYLEKLNYRAVLIGFIFNTIGIVLGSITGKTAWGAYWAWDPKLIAVLIAWLIYGVALTGKLNFHWKGNHLAYLSLIGFSWIIFSMLIITNYFSKIHSFI